MCNYQRLTYHLPTLLIKLAQACEHISHGILQNAVFPCEVIGGIVTAFLQAFLASAALEGNPFFQSNPTSHRLAVLIWEAPLSWRYTIQYWFIHDA